MVEVRLTDTGDVCPHCAGLGRVVTVVTLRSFGTNPRRVLVTRQCLAQACQFKYPVMKTETELTADEQARWRQP